jgi:hypothetical protein
MTINLGQAIGSETLKMLVPDNIRWTIYGDQYSGIIWHDGDPYITEEEFNQGKIDVIEYLEQKELEKQNKRQAAINKLQQLGLTEEDIQLIVGI